MCNFDVALGKLSACTGKTTRNEQDFLEHIKKRVLAEPLVSRWRFIVDNLNTHQSASLVRYVAAESDLDLDLGVQGKSGILKSNLPGLKNSELQQPCFYYLKLPNKLIFKA